ncbi:uncharacterized protein TNCV_1655771 [Trichonephila clavipes]|nr:uncharacterized protein TNCV_1655771 [Trichonephila clavipes]
MEAAFTLWKRSTSLGFRYIAVSSDGDCKTFSYLCQKKVYGPDIVIKKEGCIDHVSKRLGTALRSTVKDFRAQVQWNSLCILQASDHHQGVLPQNWGGNEPNRTVTCMVLKAKANDRRQNLALSRDEFRGPRSVSVGQIALVTTHDEVHIYTSGNTQRSGWVTDSIRIDSSIGNFRSNRSF